MMSFLFTCLAFGVAVPLLVLYAIWDVNYFIRVLFTVGLARIFGARRRLTDTTAIWSLCTTQDVDIFIKHMNNARYVRELDFARFHYYAVTGLYEAVRRCGGGAVQGASSVRYRRTIPIFSAYRITTRLVWWDEQAIYLEQRFVTRGDGFVRAVALSKQCITGLKGVTVLDVMAKFKDGAQRPAEQPEELRMWLESLEVTGAKLRKAKDAGVKNGAKTGAKNGGGALKSE